MTGQEKDHNVDHVPDVAMLPENSRFAQVSHHEEHETTILMSLAYDPWASAWCIYAVWCVILISFDIQAGGAVLGIPQFRTDFGSEFVGQFVLSVKWQSAFNAAPFAW